MTDKAWAEGMAEFQKVGMPGWPYDDSEVSMGRAEAYRRHLDVLSDAQWLHAVRESIAGCKWFPTVHEVLDFGNAYAPPTRMLPAARPDEQKAHDREVARRGVEMIRQAALEAGLVLK